MRLTRTCWQTAQRLGPRASTTAFVGLGRMGSEMAYNLFTKTIAANPESRFIVCDALPDAASAFHRRFSSAFPTAQLDVVASPADAALASGTIVTMLPSSAQIKTVYKEIIPVLGTGTTCIDSTTLDVEVAKDVAKQVIATGARMVDAPVSGGVTGAKAGSLAFLVGGTQESFEAVRPTLALMGQRIVHCGPSGAGLGAKICNNLILGVQQIVVAEAMVLGQRLGLDAAVLTSVIGSSTGNCWSLSVNNPVPHALGKEKSPPCERGYEGGFATSLMEKDMGLASDIADKTGTPLPMGDAALGLYIDMLEEHPELANLDFSCVYTYIRGAE